MKFFTTPNSKNIVATLRIVTKEKSELTFLLILCVHVPFLNTLSQMLDFTWRIVSSTGNLRKKYQTFNCRKF